MRKPLIFFFIIISSLLSIHSSAQNSLHKTKEEVINLLCRKWQMEEMESEGKIVKMPSAHTWYYNFSPEGTVLFTTDGEDTKQYWKYDDLANIIAIKEDENADRKDVFEIISISNNTLTLWTDSEGFQSTIHFVAVK